MTRYEKGFIEKCAEYGIKQADASTLFTNYAPDALIGTGIGALTGALVDRKKRLRGALIGAGIGGVGGLGLRYALAGKDISLANRFADRMKKYIEETDPNTRVLNHLAAHKNLLIQRRRIPFLGYGKSNRDKKTSLLDTWNTFY